MTSDNLMDPGSAVLPGSTYVEPRADMIGHVWREGKCTGCNLTMANASSVLCPSQACDPEPVIPRSHPDMESALKALVVALGKGAIPGNASAEYNSARRLLGVP